MHLSTHYILTDTKYPIPQLILTTSKGIISLNRDSQLNQKTRWASHNRTAAQFLKKLGQPLLNHLLNIVVLALLLMLSTMLLLPTLMLLASMLLASMMLLASTMLSTRISSIPTRRRGHVIHIPSREVNVHAPLIRLGAILQSQFATHLFDARLYFLDVIRGVIALADNDV
jgi:hypothetical protein